MDYPAFWRNRRLGGAILRYGHGCRAHGLVNAVNDPLPETKLLNLAVVLVGFVHLGLDKTVDVVGCAMIRLETRPNMDAPGAMRERSRPVEHPGRRGSAKMPGQSTGGMSFGDQVIRMCSACACFGLRGNSGWMSV